MEFAVVLTVTVLSMIVGNYIHTRLSETNIPREELQRINSVHEKMDENRKKFRNT